MFQVIVNLEQGFASSGAQKVRPFNWVSAMGKGNGVDRSMPIDPEVIEKLIKHAKKDMNFSQNEEDLLAEFVQVTWDHGENHIFFNLDESTVASIQILDEQAIATREEEVRKLMSPE